MNKSLILLKSRQVGKSSINIRYVMEYLNYTKRKDRIFTIKKIFNI